MTEDQKLAIILDKIAQDLKMIELSKRNLRRAKRVLPFAIFGAVIAALPLLGSILSVAPIGILLFGAIFSAVMSQIVGPYGSLTRMKSEPEKIEERLDSLEEGVVSLQPGPKLIVFGVKSISKSKVGFSENRAILDQELLASVSKNGVFPSLAPYKYLGLAIVDKDGSLSCSHKALDRQDWVNLARHKGFTAKRLDESLHALSG